MSIIMGALGGAGESLVNMATEAQKQQDALDLESARAESDLNRQIALSKLQNDRANAPLQRFGALVQQIRNTDVPVHDAPVTTPDPASNDASQIPKVAPVTPSLTPPVTPPLGSRAIGKTPDGKTVFQTPDGKKYAI